MYISLYIIYIYKYTYIIYKHSYGKCNGNISPSIRV